MIEYKYSTIIFMRVVFTAMLYIIAGFMITEHQDIDHWFPNLLRQNSHSKDFEISRTCVEISKMALKLIQTVHRAFGIEVIQEALVVFQDNRKQLKLYNEDIPIIGIDFDQRTEIIKQINEKVWGKNAGKSGRTLKFLEGFSNSAINRIVKAASTEY